MKNLPLLLLTFFCTSLLAQVPETEPNNSFSTANIISRYEIKSATVNATTDVIDYYRAILPEDGTLKLFVQGTNTSGNGGWLYISGYDRRKTNDLIGRYAGNKTNVLPGINVFDTITLHGRAADTIYFSFHASTGFSYQFSYNLTNLSTNDVEPNGTFVSALPISVAETKAGHTNYAANGNTLDEFDFYRTILPADGTMKVYVKALNMGASNGWLYMAGFDRRKTNSHYDRYIANNTSVPAGGTVYDTLTIRGMAADTFYYRFHSSGPFSYEFRYEVTEQSTNDAEPNGSFASALPIAQSQTLPGHINYYANGGTLDEYDYYRTTIGADGTLKIYVQSTNRSPYNSWMYLAVYDRTKTNAVLNKYISDNTNVPVGGTVTDTITIYGRAADTVYFRIHSVGAFSYSLMYNMTDQTPNDPEPNNTFATATPAGIRENRFGHTNYAANNGTLDPFDYYMLKLPYDGTVKIYVEGTNASGFGNWLHIEGYDRRKTNALFSRYIGNNTSAAAGAKVRDTITVYGRAADTMYLRLYAPNAFSYKFSYDITDTSKNDSEPNNSFAEAISLSGTQVREGHTNYAFNGTTEEYDFYKTEFTASDSLKLYVQATNMSGSTNHFYLYGYNGAQNNIYNRVRYNIPAGSTILDSVKIAVTAPQTIYNRVSASAAFMYQLSTNLKQPGNGFSISGKPAVCFGSEVYKAIDVTDKDVTYHWSLSGGGTLSVTDSIATINWTAQGVHLIQLYLTNANGTSVTRNFQVTVNETIPLVAPVITANGRYLRTGVLPLGAERHWYKDGSILPGVTDSVYYAATAGNFSAAFANICGEGPRSTVISLNAPQAQTLSFPAVTPVVFSPDSFRIMQAVASSGLPVQYEIVSGPGIMYRDTLRGTAYGTVIVRAKQPGNVDYNVATPAETSVNITKAIQTITFNPIPDKIYSNTGFALDAGASSGLPVQYAVVSGPASVSGNVLTMLGAGIIQVKAMQAGDVNYLPATEVTTSFCVGLRVIEPITGPALVCASTQRYLSKKIPGAIYQWTINGGGILTSHGDTAIVQWQTAGVHNLSVKAHSSCDTTNSASQSFSITVDPDYTVSAPTGLIPATNITDMELPVTLRWVAPAKATSYDLYVWPSSQPEAVLPFDSGFTQTYYTLRNNIALNTPYSWKVVARNICSAASSPVQQFTASTSSSDQPDLVMDTVTIPETIYQGQPITVTWRVKNAGAKGTGLSTWKDRIYLSTSNDLRTREATLLGAFDNPSYLLPGESYTQTKTVTIPQGFAGIWYLFVITENGEAFCFSTNCNIFWGPRYNHSVSPVLESNEFNNYRYFAVPILDGLLPDLQVKSVGVPSTVFGGSHITATYTVKNEGKINAAGTKLTDCPQRGWQDRFFISSHPTFDISTARELEKRNIIFYKPGTTDCVTEPTPYADYLQPDSSYTLQQELTLPFNYFGTQYIYVYTNGSGNAYEGPFSTNNIRRSDSINITVAPPSDLVVSTITNIPDVQAGNELTLNWIVTNQGANSPQETGWIDSVYICSSPVFSYENLLLKTAAYRTKPAAFNTGDFYNGQTRFTVPNGISGSYYVFVKTDARNEVFEFTMEMNNTLRSNQFQVRLNPLADLVITSVTAPDSVRAETPFTMQYTIKNQGSDILTGSWEDQVFVSTDTTRSAGGITLAKPYNNNITLTPGEAKTITQQVVVRTTHDLNNQRVYLKVQADSRQFIYEHQAEENNTGAQITGTFVKPVIVETIVKAADISVQSFNAPLSFDANTNINVSWAVQNTGRIATNKTYWFDRVYLSADTVINNADYELNRSYISEYSNNGLAAGDGYTKTATLKIPLKVYGPQYLIFVTDYGSNVENDSTNANNRILLPVNVVATPTADLVITPLNDIPAQVWGGSTFYLKYRVENTGVAATMPDTRWYDHIHVVDGPDVIGFPLVYKEHTTPLAAGASYIDSLLVTIPNYYNGNYSFILYTDGSNHLYEGPAGEGNNSHKRIQTIQPYNTRPAPDLIVSAVTVPSSALLGKDMTAFFTIKNIGVNPAAGNLANALYLSNNRIFESNLDQLIAAKDSNNFSLAPGDSAMASLSGKALPETAGIYHGLVRTNVRNTLHEANQLANNTGTSDNTISVDARVLTLGETAADILVPNDGSYYKVSVAAGLDLSVSLSTNMVTTGTNALHIAHNKVPSDLVYDATGVNTASLNQTALLSGTQSGDYYIKAQSYGVAQNEPVSILVKTLPFSIVGTSPAVAGKGIVSGQLFGGGFKTNTQIVLRNATNTYAVAAIRQFVNSTTLNLLWNLENVPVGVYNIVAINPGGEETMLNNGLTVEVSSGYKLEYTPLLPSEVRPFAGVFTYKGKNTGNVNIPVIHGDITSKTNNAKIYKVSTTGGIKRMTKYFNQYDSLVTEDFYISNKNTVVPFFGRNIAPGEEFTITVETRFIRENIVPQNNIVPMQCRMFVYAAADLAKEQIRNFETVRLLIANHPDMIKNGTDAVYRKTQEGSKPFIEKMISEYVAGGLMLWTDTIGLNSRYDCSRCLRNLPEVRPAGGKDTFTYNPGDFYVTGKQTVGTNEVLKSGATMLLEINRARYWNGFKHGTPGSPGAAAGWDLLHSNGAINISATKQSPFKIYFSSLYPTGTTNNPGQCPGWSPATDTSFAIITAANGITGFDSSKFQVDLSYFAGVNPLRGGRFVTQLRQGAGGKDTIMLVFRAYKPTFGEAGVDGVDAVAGEDGSPGGKGGPGNSASQRGGRGGKGGNGGNEANGFAGDGGVGGDGGDGYGPGGDGGPGGKGGQASTAKTRGGDGNTGGKGGNGGPNGGNGGNGGPGGAGAEGGDDGMGGTGGDGGDAGNGNNSSYGGNGGLGGDGGRGGNGCSGGKGSGPGDGGAKGFGPLGSGTDGATGKTGQDGTGRDCGCGVQLAPKGDPNEAAAGIIDLGKSVNTGILGAADQGLWATTDIILEGLDQNTKETSPGLNATISAVDAFVEYRKVTTFGGDPWAACCKAAVAGLKIGDYINRAIYGTENYVGSTEINNVIDGIKSISSVPDFLAFLAKKAVGGVSASFMVSPCDPNEIKGPAGYGDAQIVSKTATMAYNIHFENDSTLAEVSAQRVIVRQKISPKADPLTFKVGSFNFGGYSFDVLENKSNYFTVINLDSLGYRVEVTAGIDIVNREAFWVFQTIDPATGLAPENVFTGFLPVNDASNRGTGFVNYSIKPLATAVTGDSIAAKASIIFDANAPIETNTWINLVDAVAPTSSLTGLPETSNNPVVNIRYSGTDDAGGSGINYVDLYLSDNGATPLLFAKDFTATDTLFYGEQNHTYTFYARATDHVGNREDLKNLGSVSITSNSCLGGLISFSSSLTGSSYQWQVNTGSGFVNLANDAHYTGANTRILAINNAAGTWYGYEYRCLVNGNSYSSINTLRFTNFWEGTLNTAWENPANWSCGTLPDQYADVVIPGGKTRYPEVNSNTTVRTIRSNPGAVITVKTGANITVLK